MTIVAPSPRPRRSVRLLLAAVMAVGAAATAGPASAAAPESRTAVIVQLAPGSDAAAESRRAAAQGGSVSHVYRNVFAGFAGEFTDRAISALRHNPRVTLIEADGVATAVGTQSPAPSWGLDRIDQHTLPLSTTYTYPGAAGSGVTAYVIDTGIDETATDFSGRVGAGTDLVDGDATPQDCNGHGTHVAGTIGGTTYGAAKSVTLVAVRVLGCDGSGTWSGVVAGIDWVARQHDAGQAAVANMSLGGSRNSSVDTAVRALVTDGVTVAVAAGNSSANACNYSPARVPEALTVGATDTSDTRASFSNFGSCLDLFAPGVGITSDWLGGATKTISGTSMASPHVAGAAALVLSGRPGLSPAEVRSELVSAATAGVVRRPGAKSPNLLLFVTGDPAAVTAP